MKRHIIALFGLGLSNVIAAPILVDSVELPFPEHERWTLVSVPQLPGGFFIGASGLYLMPTSDGFDLSYFRNPATFRVGDIKPGYNWGWGINGGYVFPNTGNDMEIRYVDLSTRDSNSTSLPTELFSLDNYLDPPNFIVGIYQTAHGTARFNLNQVDALGGQFIDVGTRLFLHAVAGVRWADVGRKMNNNYVGVLSTVGQVLSNSLFLDERSDFNGVGPVVGFDANYALINGFGLAGHADTALLVGNLEVNTNAVFSTFLSGVGEGTTNISSKINARRRLVPVVDGKLGFDYTYLFGATGSDLVLEVGYQADQYFNTVGRAFHTTRFVPVTTIESANYADTAFNGPYINLTVHV